MIHGKCHLVPLALGQHLNALSIEDDHLVGVGSHHLEGDEIPDLDMVSYNKGGPNPYQW